jgi:hypothetical protein
MKTIKRDYKSYVKRGLLAGAALATAGALAATPMSAKADAVDNSPPKQKLDIKKVDKTQDNLKLEYKADATLTVTPIAKEEVEDDILNQKTKDEFEVDHHKSVNEQIEINSTSVKLMRSAPLEITADTLSDLDFNQRVQVHNELVRQFNEMLTQYEAGNIPYGELQNLYAALQTSYQELMAEQAQLLADEAQREIDEREAFERAEAKREAAERAVFEAEEQARREKEEAEFKTQEAERKEAEERRDKIKHLIAEGFLSAEFDSADAEGFSEAFEKALADYEAALAEWQNWDQAEQDKLFAERLRAERVAFLKEIGLLSMPEPTDAELDKAWATYQEKLAQYKSWNQEEEQARADRAALIQFLINNGFLTATNSENDEAIKLAEAEWREKLAEYELAYIAYKEQVANFRAFVEPFLPDGVTFETASSEQLEEAYAAAIAAGIAGSQDLLNDQFDESKTITDGSQKITDDLSFNYRRGTAVEINHPNHIDGNPTGATHFPGLGVTIYNGRGSEDATLTFDSNARTGFYEFYIKTTGATVIYVVIHLTQEIVDHIAQHGNIVFRFTDGMVNNAQGIMAREGKIFTPAARPSEAPPTVGEPETDPVSRPKVPAFTEPEATPAPRQVNAFDFKFTPDTFVFEDGTFMFKPETFEFDSRAFETPVSVEIPDAPIEDETPEQPTNPEEPADIIDEGTELASPDNPGNIDQDYVYESGPVYTETTGPVQAPTYDGPAAGGQEAEPETLLMATEDTEPATITPIDEASLPEGSLTVEKSDSSPTAIGLSSLAWALTLLFLLRRKRKVTEN